MNRQFGLSSVGYTDFYPCSAPGFVPVSSKRIAPMDVRRLPFYKLVMYSDYTTVRIFDFDESVGTSNEALLLASSTCPHVLPLSPTSVGSDASKLG